MGALPEMGAQKGCKNMSKTLNAKRGADSQQRLVRHTVAARVSSMESEKLYLQNLHGDISRLRLSIADRIAALDRQIAAEKASVPNAPAHRPAREKE